MDVSPDDMASAIMTKKVVTVDINEPARNALKLMIDHDIGSVIVTENGKPVGIVTERNITKKSLDAAEEKGFYNRPTGEFTSRPLITIRPDTPIWESFELMLNNKIRRLPVLSNDQLVGLVTERDLFRWVVRVSYEVSPNVYLTEDAKKALTRLPEILAS